MGTFAFRLFYFKYMVYSKLASAIFNDIQAGLRGYSANLSLSLDQLEDDVIDERLQIIKEYALKGILPKKDLMLSINCIPVDCESLDRCCVQSENDELVAHFEIPQVIADFGTDAIEYIGATDRQLPFIWYNSINSWRAHKYRKRGKNRPYVYVDMTPNKNNMYDCFVFNAPLLRMVSVVAIFKDPRQAMEYNCCNSEDIDNPSFLNNEIKRRLTEKKIRFYRQLAPMPVVNDQIAR